MSTGVSDTMSTGVSDTHNKTQGKHKINTYMAATASTGAPPLNDKEKKPTPDALFNAVAESLFAVTNAKVAHEGHIAKARAVFARHSISAPRVADFVSWYRETYPDAALPRDAAKLELHVLAWLSSSAKPAAAFEIIEFHDPLDDLRGA